MEPYTTTYDITTSEAITDCPLNPTAITQDDFHWLYARNNKYDDNNVDYTKVGKWMLFISRDHIDEQWGKIKASVQSGNLWDCKVSTLNPSSKVHAVMIYTKDYTDIEDVKNVLEYLEESGIKQPSSVIYYKTDELTRAGVYSGGKQKAWIYSSKTVRLK